MRRYSAAAVCATDLQRTAAQVPGATNPNQASSLLQQIGTGVVSGKNVSKTTEKINFKVCIQRLISKFMITLSKKIQEAVIINILLKYFSYNEK